MKQITRRDFLAMSAAVAALPSASLQDADDLVVHEWGVATIPYGHRFANLRTAGSKSIKGFEQIAGLPGFVATWEQSVGETIEEWRTAPTPVTKPIVYFYSRRPRTVKLKVCIPTGRPSSWWPPAQDYGPKPALPARGRDGMEPEAPKPSSIEPKDGLLEWTDLALAPDAAGFRESTGWWATARKPDSCPVRSEGEAEKFLFYDGFADFSPAARVDWAKDGRVTVANGSPDPYAGVIAVRVEEGDCWSAVHGRLARDASATLKPAKGAPDLARELRTAGLTPKEADSLVEIWSDEFFRIDGVRVLVLLDRAAYDRLLPIEITPAPKELVRVLIAHLECLDDERVARIKRWIADLGSEELTTRDMASARLRQLGPLAHPYVREAADQAADPEFKARLEALLPAAK